MLEADSETDTAFMQLLTRHQRDLRAFIIGVTPTITDADDILQEVNLSLWKKRQLYDRGQEFLRWAFGFAVMEVRNFRNRTAKSKLWFNDNILEMVAEAYPHDAQVVEQRRDALFQCVQKLGAIERQFIIDFYRNQCSAQHLADASGKPLSTVYKTLTRARLALRACIERTLAQEARSV
jgi:RNA polymerase sigma-70 factor (ECF subfamily)